MSGGKNHWQLHNDLIVFRRSFCSSNLFDVMEKIADDNKCSRIAILDYICENEFRTPKIELIKGSNTIITHVDNKIKYKFDIAKCMFSFGNINEKLRISKINCDGETIVDLFAGIGYFTLPFLVHCKANKVYACDWNPYAIEALKENLTINKVADRCHVLFGDCREVCPIDVANRVCLGLIPSSKIGWETACKAIRKDLGGIFHLHQNITTFGLKSKVLKKKAWLESGQEIANEIAQIFKRLTNTNWNVEIVAINPVKSYAPHIDHLVYDLNCRPFMDTN